MKKTLFALGIVGIATTGFLITDGQAESNSPATQNTTVNTQVTINNKDSIEALNRLHGALMLAEALNIESVEPTVHYEDVPDEYQGIINALVNNNIVGSITMDYFGSDEPMTHGETAIWINEGFKLPTVEQNSYSFSDVNELCTQDIANVVGNGIIDPNSDTTFGIGEEVTLEQYASYLEEAIKGGIDNV